ncbi:MAG: plasmid pRiA4b ORF-3 family protein [Spartobacteria bacterium]|nr:plasmid pRiA4b ORF-3 family protein [Spartobacteria bacterium]
MTATQKKKKERPVWNAIQLKVKLRHLRPPIWRRVVVPDNITLGDLHQVIQVTMGWYNCHMHCFRIGDIEYTSRDASEMGELDMDNEERVPLAAVLTHEKQKFIYEYDFGDSWEHEVVVEKFLPLDPATKYPVCLGGARACPPEDCGGFPGYENILDVLKDENRDEEKEELLEWIGEDYDPELFDLSRVNWQLGALGS